MTAPDENTLDPITAKRQAKAALEQSEANTTRTLGVVEEAKRTFRIVRDHRERNHYRDSMAAIMRGAH